MLDIKGSITAIITPFDKEGNVDQKVLRNLVEFHILNGTNGIVPCGTTGESATLSHDEHFDVVEIVIDQVAGRVPVIAGAGSNSTLETKLLTKHAKDAGADAALLITPYYNKPTQEGLYQHYNEIAKSVDIPIVLYNVPGRTALNMLPETVIRLSKIDNIIGIKEASGSIEQSVEIMKYTENFSLLSGEDFLTYPLMTLGATGVISVTNNVVPNLMATMCSSILDGKYLDAREIHFKLSKLFKVLFCETNPIPVKKALYLMGMIQDEVRLPLTCMSEQGTDVLKSTMHELGLDLVNS